MGSLCFGDCAYMRQNMFGEKTENKKRVAFSGTTGYDAREEGKRLLSQKSKCCAEMHK